MERPEWEQAEPHSQRVRPAGREQHRSPVQWPQRDEGNLERGALQRARGGFHGLPRLLRAGPQVLWLLLEVRAPVISATGPRRREPRLGELRKLAVRPPRVCERKPRGHRAKLAQRPVGVHLLRGFALHQTHGKRRAECGLHHNDGGRLRQCQCWSAALPELYQLYHFHFKNPWSSGAKLHLCDQQSVRWRSDAGQVRHRGRADRPRQRGLQHRSSLLPGVSVLQLRPLPWRALLPDLGADNQVELLRAAGWVPSLPAGARFSAVDHLRKHELLLRRLQRPMQPAGALHRSQWLLHLPEHAERRVPGRSGLPGHHHPC